jgi:hypothetical protein
MMRNFDLPMPIEHVDYNSPSLRVYLQKISLKEKVKQVEEQKLGFKNRFAKGEGKACRRGINIRHTSSNCRLDLHLEVPKIFGLPLDPKIHSSNRYIKMNFKRAKDQLSHINRFYTFLPITCTTTENVDLDWDDFVKFYKLLYSITKISKHVMAKFLDLLHFLNSWVVYREEKYHWWRQNALHQVVGGWDQEQISNHEFNSPL